MVEVFTLPPKPGVKLSKKDAGYVDKGPFGCRNCSWFEGGKASTGDCDVVGGSVSRNGCCDFWNDQDAPKDKGKAGTEYVFVPPYTYTCSICRFFDSSTKTCTPVRGTISPGGSCNKWMPTSMIESHLLFPDAAKVIREAATSGVGRVQEANPMNGVGGRVAKTDPETLATLNAPCSTCGHSYLSHNLDKKCFFCLPKGSQHVYHESPDLSPHLLNIGGKLARPDPGITGTVKESVGAQQIEEALDRILETYFASMGPSDERSTQAMKDGDEQRKHLTLYNAHSTAAHRSSTAAYSGGGDNSAAHQVAAEHHKLAAEAANKASDKAKNPQAKKDLQIASKYHNAQATAHKAAAQTQESGNRQPYSWETSGRDY